tara:strand:+ start:1473 stop:2180 length:708 start_codon:yes stop_codon:yes gene_type:complete
MSRSKSPSRLTDDPVAQFLAQVKRHPAPAPQASGGRLIFALDATASRQPTWDTACQLQAGMFTHTRELGQLQVKLCFYRGYDELRSSPWLLGADKLIKAMSTVECLGGQTQIARLLTHALRIHQQQPVQALIFIGDCIEEPLDELCQLAGECGLRGLPLFLFQEGSNRTASQGFKQLARLSQGAHCCFDLNSPEVLSELLRAIAVYATAGPLGLKNLEGSAALQQLTRQLEHPKS